MKERKEKDGWVEDEENACREQSEPVSAQGVLSGGGNEI